MTIQTVGAELLYTDRRTYGGTDMKKLLVTFRKFANAPKKDGFVYVFTNFYLNMDLLPFDADFKHFSQKRVSLGG